MDLTKKGLSEFKMLMKDSSKDWKKNQERFSEGRPEPLIKDDNRTLNTDSVTNSDNFSRMEKIRTRQRPEGLESTTDSNHTDSDTIGVSQNTSLGDRRKRQIDLGHMILGYFKEEAAPPKKTGEERIGPGRPEKEKSEKVRVVSL